MPSASQAVAGPKKSVLALLAVVASVLLAAQIYWVGPALIWETLTAADRRWSAAALLAIVVSAVLGGFNVWLLCVRREGIAFAHFLRQFWVGWSVGLVFPGQIGDTLTTSFLLRENAVPVRRSLSGMGLDKLVSLVLMLASACSTPLVVAGAPTVIVAVAFACLLVLGIVAVLATSNLIRLPTVARRIPALTMLADVVGQSAQLLRSNPGLVAVNGMLTLIKLGVTGLSYWCAIQAMGHQSPISELPAITLCAVSAGLIAYVPVSLNGLGTVEFTGIMLFGLVGIEPATVLPAYLYLRISTLVAAFLPTAVIALWTAHRRRLSRQ